MAFAKVLRGGPKAPDNIVNVAPKMYRPSQGKGLGKKSCQFFESWVQISLNKTNLTVASRPLT